MSDIKKCAHSRCSCTVTDSKKYCCETCETSAGTGTETIACDCPHNSCAGHL